MRTLLIGAATTSLLALAGLAGAAEDETTTLMKQLSASGDRELSVVLPTNPDNPNPLHALGSSTAAKMSDGEVRNPDHLARTDGAALNKFSASAGGSQASKLDVGKPATADSTSFIELSDRSRPAQGFSGGTMRERLGSQAGRAGTLSQPPALDAPAR